MSGERTPSDLQYTRTHEWIRLTGDVATVGMTGHAQAELTDIVFVNLPAPPKAVRAEATALVLESVKTVADVYAPADGTIIEVNTELKAHPEYVNQDPYGKGWLFKEKLAGPLPADRLLTADGYQAHLRGGGAAPP